MKSHPPKYVVGIGASAGGLEAIQEFFSNLPKSDELAFIVVQHLSPNFISMMDELLAHHTLMPIVNAKNGMAIQAGTIYLIPATFEALIISNCFELNTINRASLPLPIDTLFESLALMYGQYAIGIILSGTGSDGVNGMVAIAKNAGFTLAQSPNEAKFADMPSHSIATNAINFVLPVSEMPAVVLEYIQQPSEFDKSLKQSEPTSLSEYNEIFHMLDTHYHINFNVYKIGTTSRRIQRRMQLQGIKNIHSYVSYLANNNDGLAKLYQDLLIGVTEFFRDTEAFDLLLSDIIPLLFDKAKKTQEDIRVWINPCATGEEAYSVAILFKHYADTNGLPFSVKIFASDVFNGSIQEAKTGIYSYKSVAQIPRHLLNKYFIKFADHYEVVPEIKRAILFTNHNLLRDPPFTNIDLICCRNLLIYINPKEQKYITDLLRFSLNIGGFLFLGPSEGVPSLLPDLMVINQLWKIFKKNKRSNFPLFPAARLNMPSIKEMDPPSSEHINQGSLPQYAYNAILADVVSSGFIIDTAYTIVHSIGKARELLTLTEGVPTLILPKIIVDDLKGALIAAIHQAKSTLMPVAYENIIVHQHDTKPKTLKMTVHPICNPHQKIAFFWVRLDQKKTKPTLQKKIIISESNHDYHNENIIVGLEQELSDARILLQSSLENMESVNEEMQSTNEELMASNEELQSTNEELQSVNEEMYIINQERSIKIDEVIQAKTDIDNLIRCAEICTIILNEALEIRIFTPAIEKIFNLVKHDIGRPLKNFRHNLQFDLLLEKTEDVLKNNTLFETEVKNEQGYWYFLKIIPYYASQNQTVTGVVISLTDINNIKLLQQQKLEVEKDLKLALKTGRIGIWHYHIKNETFTYDDTIKHIFDIKKPSDLKTIQDFIRAIHPNDRKHVETALAATISRHKNFEQNFRITRPNGSIRYLSCTANLHRDSTLRSRSITGICWDVTEKYWLEETVIDAEHLNLGLDAITDGWWDWDLVKQTIYLSPLLKKTLGYADHELINQVETYEQLIVPDDRQRLQEETAYYLSERSTHTLISNFKMKHKNGHTMWVLARRKGIANKQGTLIRMVGTITDISALKETEQRLEKLAYHDFLTQVSNRPAFIDALTRAIARSKRNQSLLAVMFIDIDDFKDINDQWGHAAGDAILCEFTNRLSNFSRTVDLVARLGGDEFGIILEDIVSIEEVRPIAARYLSAFAEPLLFKDYKISISISMGIAFYPQHGNTAQEILEHADKNMYIAKELGKNQFVL